jgi:hypothetical protein
MRKAACHLDGVDSLNPRRWRGERLHHHGGGVCWLFVLLWMDLWRHELIVCKKWYKNNLKMRLTCYFLIHVGVHHTSGQIDLAQSHQSGKLHRMANADRPQCQKVLSQNYQNRKGAPDPNKKEHTVHQS